MIMDPIRLRRGPPVPPLPLQHIYNAVHGAEGAGATASSAAVHNDRTFALTSGFVGAARVWAGLVGADNGVAVFDKGKDVGRVGWGTEVGPRGVLELGEFAEGLEGVGGVGQG